MTGGIRPAGPDDLGLIAEIYDHYVDGSAATFDLDRPPIEAWEQRLAGCAREGYPFLVSCLGERVAAYAYAGQFRPRRAYAETVETSIYVSPEVTGQGLGRPLYAALLEGCSAGGFHLAVAATTLPNPASVALHASVGFEVVGTFREVGRKFGTWHDVQWWQRVLG